MYDLPASIDYVLKTTGHKKVSYVGYSLGSAVFFVGANLKPELNDKIEVMINLAPTSTVQRLDNLFKLIAPLSNPLKVSVVFFLTAHMNYSLSQTIWIACGDE